MGTQFPSATRPRLIRIAVVDDHRSFAAALAEQLALDPRLSVVGVAGSAEEAEELLAWQDVDLLLLDLDLAGVSGLELFRGLRATRPALQALVITASAHPSELLDAVRSGVTGWVEKVRPVGELLDAVLRAAAGEASFPGALLARALESDTPAWHIMPGGTGAHGGLSHREIEILSALADGWSRQRIADELHISVHTVRTHVQHILGKLHVPTALAAVHVARDAGLLDARWNGVSTK